MFGHNGARRMIGAKILSLPDDKFIKINPDKLFPFVCGEELAEIVQRNWELIHQKKLLPRYSDNSIKSLIDKGWEVFLNEI